MKCKKCNKEINLIIFEMPEDICWGCLEDKNEILDKNINTDTEDNEI